MMLLIQIAEMDLPCILALNMEDEAAARGIEIQYRKLEELLGITVIGTVAPQRKGIAKLRDSLLDTRKPVITAGYGEVIETYIEKISTLLPESHMARRAISLMVLAGDESLRTWCVANLDSRTIDRL